MLRKDIDWNRSIVTADDLADLFTPADRESRRLMLRGWANLPYDAASDAAADYLEPAVAFIAWRAHGRDCTAGQLVHLMADVMDKLPRIGVVAGG